MKVAMRGSDQTSASTKPVPRLPAAEPRYWRIEYETRAAGALVARHGEVAEQRERHAEQRHDQDDQRKRFATAARADEQRVKGIMKYASTLLASTTLREDAERRPFAIGSLAVAARGGRAGSDAQQVRSEHDSEGPGAPGGGERVDPKPENLVRERERTRWPNESPRRGPAASSPTLASETTNSVEPEDEVERRGEADGAAHAEGAKRISAAASELNAEPRVLTK